MGSETAAAMDEGWDVPPDVLVEILLRLRTCARRFRLVCRRWSEVIDAHTTVLQCRPKTLAFVADPGGTTVSAHVMDDLSEGLSRQLWTGGTTAGNDQDCPDVAMIGTRNGLICLCDKSKPGEITLVNPATHETLPVPPLSSAGQPGLLDTRTMDHKAYSFAYHPRTGRYKILHVPCSCSSGAEKFDAVQVLTLGDASWRAVPTPGASCDLDRGLIAIDAAVFWITAGTKRGAVIMSFDLESERLASTKPLPVQMGMVRHLVEIHGRLGVATMATISVKNTQIWILGDEGWSQRYSVIVQGSIWQSLTLPHFAEDKYILMRDWVHQRWIVCRHIPRDKMLKPSMVIVRMNERGTAVAPDISGSVMRTFSYVETTEPLSCYAQASIDSSQ